MPLEPVTLSIDLRVQNIVREVAARPWSSTRRRRPERRLRRRNRRGPGDGIVARLRSQPAVPARCPTARSTRNTEKGLVQLHHNATFEMGSTFKSFTLAMGLDEGKVTLNSVIDASRPIRMGGFTIKDFKGKNRPLTIPEIFQYSSNIGTAGVADLVGIERHQEFLTRLTALQDGDRDARRGDADAAEGRRRSTRSRSPMVTGPRRRRSRQPLPPPPSSMAAGLSRRHFFRAAPRRQTISPRSSSARRRARTCAILCVERHQGTGRSAQVEGFNIGGKTGTADKVNGRYATDQNFNAFVAAPDGPAQIHRADHRRAANRREWRSHGGVYRRTDDQVHHRACGTVVVGRPALRDPGAEYLLQNY